MKKNEEKIIESYNIFLSQIGIDNKINNTFFEKIMFVISILAFLYVALTSYSEKYLNNNIYLINDIYNPLIVYVSGFLAFFAFIRFWRKINQREELIKEYYKPIIEDCLGIKWDDVLLENEGFGKLNKKEYIEAGFKYADDKYDYYYESSEKIMLSDTLEAYFVQIDKLVGSNDVPHYIIDGWITKQKFNINSEKNVFNIEELISEFNIKYDYNLKNKIELNIHNGYLYIYIDNFSLYFSYSKLTNYNTYKEIYLKIKLLKDLSEFIYNKI